MLNVAVIDYDCGNMYSIIRALEKFGISAAVTNDPEVISRADRMILPGVGAFGEGMRRLRERGLIDTIKSFAKSGKPLLGICLGMQLLVDNSEEFGFHEGLGLINGSSVLLNPADGSKVPHIGWNSLWIPSHQSEKTWQDSLLSGFIIGKDVYFVHSFRVVTRRTEDCLAVTHYGGAEFASVIKKDNITGCQFHPEKSGKNGLKIINNFLSM